MPLSPAQRARYRRNIAVPGLGERGQERLLAARVVVVGAGGLGSATLPYLAGAGVGRITILDGDVVEEHNLQRQVLHHEVGRNKARSAVERLAPLNPDVRLEAVEAHVTPERAREQLAGADLVLDCTDTFAAKLLLSDTACALGVPLVWASAVGMQGQCSVFGVPAPDGEPRWLRDLHPAEPPSGAYPTAEEIGILGTTVAQVGTVQAGEALKLLAGFGELLAGRVWLLDAAAGRSDVLSFGRRTHP